MKKGIILGLLVFLMLFTVVGCGNKEDKGDRDNKKTQEKQSSKKKTKEKEKENKEEDIIIDDDEVIDIEDEDSPLNAKDENINIKEVINCDGCVFAYFSDEGDKAKKLGDTLTPDEYTTDITTIKTSGGKQRHNFFGLVLNNNTITRAYSCALKDDKVYCIEGSTNGAYHQNNIAILNQLFTADKCKTLSEGHNYWCTDGDYNGNTKTSGYTALHYETSCTIYGEDSNTGKLICH